MQVVLCLPLVSGDMKVSDRAAPPLRPAQGKSEHTFIAVETVAPLKSVKSSESHL